MSAKRSRLTKTRGKEKVVIYKRGEKFNRTATVLKKEHD